jgi:hypothetical protein
MTPARLYLDEDVRPLLAITLRDRGYDVVSAIELEHIEMPDADHFGFAALEGRALLTFNIRDFVPLASKAMPEGKPFAGLIVSNQLPFGELLRRVLRLLGRCDAEGLRDNITWLSDYR